MYLPAEGGEEVRCLPLPCLTRPTLRLVHRTLPNLLLPPTLPATLPSTLPSTLPLTRSLSGGALATTRRALSSTPTLTVTLTPHPNH